MSLLPAEIVQTQASPVASVIWLHGLGADGHDFAPVVPQLTLPPDIGIRFVFPHAPVKPVTINNGYVMPAWYDVFSLDLREVQDRDGIVQSQQQLQQLIENEIAQGIPAERIVLAGFSQGGAVALYTGLRFAQRLGGIMALSTYLPLADSTEAERAEANRNTPIMMAHGEHDQTITLQAGEESKQILEQLGYEVDWHTYAMEHSVCPEEVQDISAWLSRVLRN
ncbi:MAG: alpha/beta hydrolase fold domain-containing protein [Gammaproteobacteria bacterium]|nr:alpha/beta hydrolase fold domain-containing protein [Gammaproteobacteria bacterium]